MSSSIRQKITATLVLGAAASAGACGDATGVAENYDPAITLDRLEEVLAPFHENEELLLALDLAVGTLDYYGGSFVASAVAAVPRVKPGSSLLQTLQLRERVAPGAVPSDPSGMDGVTAGETAALRVPAGLAGRTLVWDAVDGYIPVSGGGAPAAGVRFVLYRMDPYTGYPTTPLAETGVLDLVDEYSPSGDAVRVTALRTAGPDRVIADYVVALSGTGTYSEGGMQMTAGGMFGDAARVELDLSERMTWSASADRDELALDYGFRRGGRSVTLSGRAASRFEAYEWESFDFDVAFRGSRPNVDLEARIGPDGSLRGEIRSDGRLAVHIGGYDGYPTFERAGQQRLSVWEEEVLFDVWTGISDLILMADWLLVPQEVLLE